MSTCNDCSCNGGIIFGISHCTTCGCSCDPSGNCICNPANLIDITQKRIWNTVRVPGSEYTMNLGALSVYVKPSISMYHDVNWNQMSDRPIPSNSNVTHINTVPSRGSTTRSSVTRDRPGSQAPGGKGVDIKHGSYSRYLARLKGRGPLRTQRDTTLTSAIQGPTGQDIAMLARVYGNKTKSFGIVSSANRIGSCLCLYTTPITQQNDN